ncbi:hypothetical protein BOTBODRAFT_26724 [Botryobasidium botryosum FD-172 SS1]|uniref:SSD domain-containing protein n=1 Tax=Botryobasidium botryosum (strain FD-172 SS1) TaxID=930990 RepID=A0A067N9A1_BOTB1|nr:hypothetical protein BOTBODRAFT_26724 [Botryobasidium botryosum FD-172 SS1]
MKKKPTHGRPGHCALRGTCGKKGMFGQELPCPYDGPAVEPDDDDFRSLLKSVCGAEYEHTPVCCTSSQLETLQGSLQQAESLISSCPACRNNFREFYCAFTCSPDQGTFVSVTSTQKTSSDQTAVKSVDFHVGEDFGTGFFDSCKSVKFGATNGYAMDLIGGGARNYSGFLKFMGDERPGLGSPFQINFPHASSSPPRGITPLDIHPRSCSDSELSSRCACIDCPSVCNVLPEIPSPDAPTCSIGAVSCFSFFLLLAYSLAVFALYGGYALQTTLRRRRERSYERVALFTGAENQQHSTTVPAPLRTVGLGLAYPANAASEVSTASNAVSESRQHLGRGAALIDPMESLQPRHYKLNTVLRQAFYKLGYACASKPFITLFLASVLVGLMNSGWKYFEVETDPVRLWVAPGSESKVQKEYFDEHFGPFYKTEQMFITVAHPPSFSSEGLDDVSTLNQDWVDKPVMTYARLKWWFGIEEEIRSLASSPNGYSLSDVCFKPAGPGTPCVVQSVAAWFDNDLDGYNERTWADHLIECANQPGQCLPDFGQPLGPKYVLGGVPSQSDGYDKWLEARSLVVTYVVSDSLDPAEKERAEEWERTLRAYLEDVSARAPVEAGLRIDYSTGVSLEEEINKSSNTDVKIVVLSYLVMFFYIAFTLGTGGVNGRQEQGVFSALYTWVTNFPKLFISSDDGLESLEPAHRQPHWFPRLPRQRLFVGSKFTLGLFGISLVIVSVSTTVGFFSFLGVKVTLIIAEVIPFLVLAVGVDNVFILVHELDRQNILHGPNTSAVLAGGGPMSPTSFRSPFTSSGDDSVDADSTPAQLSIEERVARALARMGPSILLSTITETVAFALGALVPMPAVRNFALYAAGSVLLGAIFQVTVFVSALTLDLHRVEANRVDCFPCIKLQSRIALPTSAPRVGGGTITRFIRRKYAPFILKKSVKGAIITIFGGVFVASLISMQHIELGLDQRLALPSDSYLIPYFDALDTFFDMGPPVYFVSRDLNLTARSNQQALCARFTTCDDFSLTNVLEAERKRPELSFISEPPASWIDDFLYWLNPVLDTCCRVRKRNPSMFCSPRDSERLCRPCFEERAPAWNITMYGLPENEEFMRYLKQWLASPTDEECPLAGKTSYSAALSLTEAKDDVAASHFRTFHTPLKTQADFIHALESARRIAADISERTESDVFPYSLFYVFFDQYLRIVSITQEILGLGLAAVLVVTASLLGSWRTGTIITAVVAMTVINVMGVMGLWGINLNAISLVNLVISLGIAVEFCSHIGRAFMGAGSGLPIDHPAGQKERDERIWTALVDVGPSVLSGITFTKLIGMSVLALTRSRLLEIYYFRMWLTLIISGAFHGLVLLPVVLSLAGGPGYALEDADEEWMSNAIRRSDYEHTPFLADSDSADSD